MGKKERNVIFIFIAVLIIAFVLNNNSSEDSPPAQSVPQSQYPGAVQCTASSFLSYLCQVNSVCTPISDGINYVNSCRPSGYICQLQNPNHCDNLGVASIIVQCSSQTDCSKYGFPAYRIDAQGNQIGW